MENSTIYKMYFYFSTRFVRSYIPKTHPIGKKHGKERASFIAYSVTDGHPFPAITPRCPLPKHQTIAHSAAIKNYTATYWIYGIGKLVNSKSFKSIQLHRSRSFSWRAGQCYGTSSISMIYEWMNNKNDMKQCQGQDL